MNLSEAYNLSASGDIFLCSIKLHLSIMYEKQNNFTFYIYLSVSNPDFDNSSLEVNTF